MTEIVTATAEILERFYGDAPARTVRAIAAVRDDRVIGVAGVYADGSRLVMFSQLTDELRRDRRSIVRGIRRLTELARARRMPVHAVADAAIEGSERLLEHIGFQRVSPEVFVWQP